MIQSRKALVLGGKTGLLGQSLVRHLEKNGWQVLSTDRAMVDFNSDSAGDELCMLIDTFEPNCLLNTVAYTAVEAAESHPGEADRLNHFLPRNLAALVRKKPIRLIHFSTDFVFDGGKETPYTPEDITNPLNIYGKTKRAGELAILDADLSAWSLIRTAWLFGSGRNNFVRAILNKCASGQDLSVIADQFGSPTYVDDLVEQTLRLIDLQVNGLFHIVNDGQASWYDLAREAVSLAGMSCPLYPVPSTEYPQKARRPHYSVLDANQVSRITGQPMRHWCLALQEYIKADYLYVDEKYLSRNGARIDPL